MIDLKDTYIENDNNEKHDLYIAECEKQGFYQGINPALTQENADYVQVFNGEWIYTNFNDDHKQITIADLKQKTVVDAVNYFKGEFPLYCKDSHEDMSQVIEAMKGFDGYSKGELTNGNSVRDNEYWSVICTIEQFNQCVKEMSEIASANDFEKYTAARRFIAASKPTKPKPFLQTGEDFEHTKTLNFILDRMIEVHGEHESVDYIHKLRNAIIFVESAESPKQKVELSKPRTKVEYVRVADSIFDLKQDFECGKLYCQDEESEDYCVCGYGERNLIDDYIHDNLYRKVEREYTWRDELQEFLLDNGMSVGEGSVRVGGFDLTDERFLELCIRMVNATKGE